MYCLKMNPETVRKAMDPDHIIAPRNILGGPGRSQVSRMLTNRSARMAREKQWLQKERPALSPAGNLTDAIARGLIKRALTNVTVKVTIIS
jgi:hypothetical protein